MPKQFRTVAGRMVLDWTLEAFIRCDRARQIVLVHNPEDRALLEGSEILRSRTDIQRIEGGATRAASVRAGLSVVASPRVLIHDAARPLVSPSLIGTVCDALSTNVGVVPALRVTDALWRGHDGRVTEAEDREGLFRAQTPQGFHTDEIRAAHIAHPGGAADDVAVARAAGLDVAIVPGEGTNLKITIPDDFDHAAQLLIERRMDIRTGNGFDVHRFGDGDHVMLCGVRIPHGRGLQGHSDADVGMHAVTDAIYGGLGEGDIGGHFPPDDPRWKGSASEIFLRHAVSLADDHGFRLTHVDCTLICENPKIGPYAFDMKIKMSKIMNLSTSCISIKATTSERLGFAGREEGIAAIATATLVRA